MARALNRRTIRAVLGAAIVAALAATAAPAQAGVTSASLGDFTATLNLNDANDNVTVSVAGGLLVHDQTTGDLHSGKDWDSTEDGDQTVPADGTWVLIVNAGGGNDAITVLAKASELAASGLNGDGGDDALVGGDSNETLSGGEGNDRLVAGKGDDIMNGGAGNDTLMWNNGDGSDEINGDGGNDVTEVTGAPSQGDAFVLEPEPGGVKFTRVNLIGFTLHTATERFQVNGLGGNEFVEADNGVGSATLLSIDGGAGADLVFGSEGPDLILGGDGNDRLNGGGGDDRIAGERGDDKMNGETDDPDAMTGEPGDDTLVWNNGDGTDVVNGDDGRDDVEVNGAPAAGDALTVQPNAGRIKVERRNLVPFSIDIGSSEALHANGLGGDDTVAVGDVGPLSVTADGGSGDDTLTGGGASDTLLGGSGDDTIDAGGGIDVVSGDEGSDHVAVRDDTADVARGGEGDDSVVADNASLDILDGFETVDRTPDDSPQPVDEPPVIDDVPPIDTPPGVVTVDTTPRPVTISGGAVKVSPRKRTASIKVSCPANSPANCRGALSVLTAGRVNLAGLKVVLQLGGASYAVVPGGTKAIRVKLVRGVERVADRKGNLKVRAIASPADSGRTASSSRRLTLTVGRDRRSARRP